MIARIPGQLGLDVAAVSPHSASLATADAVLRRVELCIYFRNDLPPERSTLYIAHELGHYFLDAETDDEDVALTAAALAGSPGTGGTAVVEAYGARERQELRANVFARELLLPADVARAAFAEGLGARAIAEQAGLELDMVRQQLLDAVLLPDEATPPTEAPPLLSDEQRDAAHAGERYVNVVAGPGTGKTTCLVERARHLMVDKGVDPSRIAALTFSNKAAGGLVDRLRLVPGAEYLWAGTFHAFGLEFLRKFHQHFGLPSDLQVVDRFEAVHLLLRLVDTVPLVHYSRLEDPLDWLPDALDGIHRLKEEMTLPEEFAAWVATQEESPEHGRQQDVITLYTAYDQTLRDAGRVDFVDLVALPARALAQDRVPFSEFVDRFEHVLVDEYQDVTEAMVSLLRQLGSRKSVWVVGDLRQAIHHWRGASIRSLLRFRDAVAEPAQAAREYELTVNRRSSEEIVAAIRVVGQEHLLQGQFPMVRMAAINEAHGPRPVIHSSGANSHGPALAAAIRALHDQGVPYSEQMVLTRKNAELEQLARELSAADIPVLYIGDLNRRPEVRHLLCLMTLLAYRHPTGVVGLDGTGLELKAADIDILLAATRDEVALQRGGWLRQPPAALSADGQVAVNHLATLLAGQSRRSNPWEFFCDLVLERRFGLPLPSRTGLAASLVRLALWQFAYAARITNSDGSFRTLLRFLIARRIRQQIGEGYAERGIPPQALALDAVRFLTIHGSKGLEAEAVHVAGMSNGAYGEAEPFNATPGYFALVPPEAFGYALADYQKDAAIERNNLLFVAVSRAKKHLHCYVQDADEAGRLRPFAGLCALATRVTSAGGNTLSASSQPPSPIVCEQFGYPDFRLYADCPRRFHYRRTLGYPEQNPDSQALRARRAVEAALAEAIRGDTEVRDALPSNWQRARLPGPIQAAALWADAEMVFIRALARLTAAGGQVITPHTLLSQTRVDLPWMLQGPASGTLTWLIPGRLTNFIQSRIRPLMNDMTPRPTSLVLYGLLDDAEVSPQRSGALKRTAVFAAAQQNERGSASPKPGYPCKRCGYALICPMLPQET